MTSWNHFVALFKMFGQFPAFVREQTLFRGVNGAQ